ncbi:hypothetical protein F5Y17DRAFT_387930 [Xylariaceae sp. FL0594]|nr:hypothetical protein F5Y17DRAFT_387930 [Xylariaceae sp. FL0594]
MATNTTAKSAKKAPPVVTVPDDDLAGFKKLTLNNETPKKTDDDGLVDNPAAIAAMVDELHGLPVSPPSLYLDLEGVNLSRHGTLSILQIHVRTTSKTYLVAVKTLQHAAFTTRGPRSGTTLKAILESPTILKVLFDVRCDSDALYSLYQITLQGLEDLQLMELASQASRPRTYICGLKRCIEKDLPMTSAERRAWMKTKDQGLKLFAPEHGGSYEVFNQRPLPEEIRQYCHGSNQTSTSLGARTGARTIATPV